jgi:hypothetical protein
MYAGLEYLIIAAIFATFVFRIVTKHVKLKDLIESGAFGVFISNASLHDIMLVSILLRMSFVTYIIALSRFQL